MAKRLTISGLAPELEAQLKALAEERKLAVSALVRGLIERAVKNRERQQVKAATGGMK